MTGIGSTRRVLKSFCTALAAVTIGLLAAAVPAGAAAWGPEFPVSPPARVDYGTNAKGLAAGANGSFVYVWTQDESPSNDVYLVKSRVSYADGTLGPIRTVAEPNADGEPNQIAVSSGDDGVVRVAWTRHLDTIGPCPCDRDRVEYVALDADGLPDSSPQVITDPPLGDELSYLALDTASDGSSLLAWAYRDDTTGLERVEASQIPASGPAGDAFPASPYFDDLRGVAIAANPAGDGFIAWSSTDTGDYRLDGRMTGPGGTMSPVGNFETDPVHLVDSLNAALDSSGKGTVVWTQSDDTQDRVHFRQMDAAGTVLGPTDRSQRVISDDTAEDAVVQSPGAAAVNGDDSVTVVFSQDFDGPGDFGVWTRSISPAGTVSPSVNQIGETGEDSEEAIIAASPSGGGSVIYQQYDSVDSQRLIRSRQLANDGSAVTPVVTLGSTKDSNDSAYADAIVYDALGSTAALWALTTDASDYEFELHGAIYDGTGPQVKLWTPSQATAGQGIVVAAEGTDRNSIGYEWSFTDGGSASGQFAKHAFAATGDFTIELTATDSAGNESTETAAIDVLPAYVAPPIAPDTRITGKPAKKRKSKKAKFKFKSSLAGSKFECRLDKAGWSSCKSPKKLKKLKKGKHTFRVRATKGNLFDKSPASYTWKVRK